MRHFIRIISFFAIIFLPFSTVIAIVPVLEPQWSIFLETDPLNVSTGDFNGDQRSEIAVGLSSNRVILFSPEGKIEWVYDCRTELDLISGIDIDGDGRDELIVLCSPYILFLNGDGKLLRKVKVPTAGSPFLSIQTDYDKKSDLIGIAVLSGDRIFYISPEGELIKKISLRSNPFQFRLIDLNGDGVSEIIVADEFEVDCLDKEGNLIWNYNYPMEYGGPKEDLPKSIRKAYTRSSWLGIAHGAKKPKINRQYWRKVDLIDEGDLDGDGLNEVVIGCLLLDTKGENNGMIVCLNGKSGVPKWTCRTPQAPLSVKLVGSNLYVSGGGFRSRTNEKFGFLLKINSMGEILEHTDFPTAVYFLRSLSDLLAVSEHENGMVVRSSSSDEIVMPKFFFRSVSSYASEPCDLNGDGFYDLVTIIPSFEKTGQYRLNSFLNHLPLYQYKGEEALADYKSLLYAGNNKAAKRSLERARYLYTRIGRKGLLSERVNEILEEYKSKKKADLIRNSILWGIIGLPILVILLLYRDELTRASAHLWRRLMLRKVRPSTDILKACDEFIHESSKKIKMMNLGLKEMRDGELVEENISFLKENIKALENTFSDYEEKINLLEESGSYSALELKKAMKSIFTSFNNVTSIADFSENDRTLYFDSLKKDVDLARHEIEKIRGIVKSHQHSFHEIANEVVKEVQAEKRSEMESLSIDVELIVEGEGYPKNIYYDEYFIWKSILLNLLRNGIESVAMALEEDTLPPQRRVVLLRLSRRDTGRVRTTIEVEDRGCGMDEDTKKWMFKRGFTQGKEAGTGQGLTEEMKDFLLKRGSLKIESLSGVGTKIRIEC